MSSVPTATRHLQAGVGPRFARLVSQRARRQHVSLFPHVFKKVLLNFSVCFFLSFWKTILQGASSSDEVLKSRP